MRGGSAGGVIANVRLVESAGRAHYHRCRPLSACDGPLARRHHLAHQCFRQSWLRRARAYALFEADCLASMSSATVLRAALTACRRVRVPIAACMVPCTSFRPAATIHTSRPRAQETADAARGLPSNVILDARAEQVLRSSEDAIDDPIAGLGRVHAIAGIPFEDVDVGASKLLTRLGEGEPQALSRPAVKTASNNLAAVCTS